MKKRYLALLMVGPLLLLCFSAFLHWAEISMLSSDVKARGNIQMLKERALHADKETSPQARIEVLSKALIGVGEANITITDGHAQAYRGSAQLLEGLAILQILFAVFVFRRVRLPNHGVQPTPKTGAADTGR